MTEICKEYANALFELAKEASAEKEFLDALKLLCETISSAPSYAALLSSPSISAEEKERMLSSAFKSAIPEHILSFVVLLCRKGHIGLLEKCAVEYELMYNEFALVASARIVSAAPLTSREEAAVIQKLERLTHKRIDPKYEIDKSILGGLIVYVGDTVFDGSLTHILQSIKDVTEK